MVEFKQYMNTFVFSDPVSRQIIEDEVLSNVTSQQASLSSPMDKKMAARKRQFELLEMQKAKQADLLKKFADKEGMNSAFDKTEISDRSSRSDVYCSICNDVCDDEYRSLFGSAIYVQTGIQQIGRIIKLKDFRVGI